MKRTSKELLRQSPYRYRLFFNEQNFIHLCYDHGCVVEIKFFSIFNEVLTYVYVEKQKLDPFPRANIYMYCPFMKKIPVNNVI